MYLIIAATDWIWKTNKQINNKKVMFSVFSSNQKGLDSTTCDLTKKKWQFLFAIFGGWRVILLCFQFRFRFCGIVFVNSFKFVTSIGSCISSSNFTDSLKRLSNLESRINEAPWINVASGKFGKKNKRSPIYILYFYY